MNSDRPFSFDLVTAPPGIPAHGRRLERRLSDLRGRFLDEAAFEALVAREDPVVYEVHEVRRPEAAGELLSGLSVVHPGLVGEEHFMTMGHFHEVRETAEIYVCLKGHGALVMEDEAGEWAVEELTPGRALYVTPGWAHRSVNVGLEEDFITCFVYPGHAGHDYGTIREQGFRKLLVRRGGGMRIVDNPRWSPRRPIP